jgi:hypothetical protein
MTTGRQISNLKFEYQRWGLRVSSPFSPLNLRRIFMMAKLMTKVEKIFSQFFEMFAIAKKFFDTRDEWR